MFVSTTTYYVRVCARASSTVFYFFFSLPHLWLSWIATQLSQHNGRDARACVPARHTINTASYARLYGVRFHCIAVRGRNSMLSIKCSSRPTVCLNADDTPKTRVCNPDQERERERSVHGPRRTANHRKDAIKYAQRMPLCFYALWLWWLVSSSLSIYSGAAAKTPHRSFC